MTSKILNEGQTSLSRSERRRTLHLLVKLAKSAQVFPQSLELQNVQCDLVKHVTGGGYGLIYKGQHEGKSICVKAVHNREGTVDKRKMRVSYKPYVLAIWLNEVDSWQAHAGELVLWANLSHSNVLPFSGIYLSEELMPRVCIVSPWMENGDLSRYMKTFPTVPLIPLVSNCTVSADPPS
jgi:serine/threonine protein kinase